MEVNEVSKFNTVPSKFDVKQQKWDELDELLKVEREWKEHEKAYQTLPNNVISVASQVYFYIPIVHVAVSTICFIVTLFR